MKLSSCLLLFGELALEEVVAEALFGLLDVVLAGAAHGGHEVLGGAGTVVLEELEVAKARGLVVIGLTGETGGKMATLCDVCLRAPSTSTPRIQECHLVLEHFICAYVEDAIFGEQRPT